MSSREIVKSSASACTWKSGGELSTQFGQPWRRLDLATLSEENEDTIPCTYLQDGVSIKISPTTHKWTDDHFHHNLRTNGSLVPSAAAAAAAAAATTKSRSGDGLVLLFQAKSRDGFSVALSPAPGFVKDNCFYEIQFGAIGNTTTIIKRRRKKTSKRSSDDDGGGGTLSKSIPSRACQQTLWISYWICFNDGKLYVGVGDIPGEDCIGFLDDSEQYGKQQQSLSDEPNEVASEMPTKSSSTRNKSSGEIRYVGFGNFVSKGAHGHPVVFQNVVLTVDEVPMRLLNMLCELPLDDLPLVFITDSTGDGNNNDDETKRLMEEYRREYQLRKSRAEKYGTEFKDAPAPHSFLPWTQAKRMKENPEKGFITGLDLMDPKEIAKREARKARFGGTVSGGGTNENNDDNEEDHGEEAGNLDDETGNLESKLGESVLPVIQAWDKFELLEPHRHDPPTSLWHTPPPGGAVDSQSPSNEFVLEPPKPITTVPEKIHIFAVDWAAFKQIRNKDIMAHFSIYGPTYVEWLGDLSCNLCFEDKYTASRALHNLSQELPSPPPPPSQPMGDSDDKDDSNNNEGTRADGDDQNNDVDDGGKEENKQEDKRPDLANMGWRFCMKPIRKVANDRHGRRGTIARVLMRLALSSDILALRPSSWPEPPGGFSSHHILGPDSDFVSTKNKRDGGRKRNKKKRRRGQQQSQGRRNDGDDDDAEEARNDKSSTSRDRRITNNDDGGGGLPPLLSRGLSSGRAGFTIEEMEQERARKKAKTA